MFEAGSDATVPVSLPLSRWSRFSPSAAAACPFELSVYEPSWPVPRLIDVLAEAIESPPTDEEPSLLKVAGSMDEPDGYMESMRETGRA